MLKVLCNDFSCILLPEWIEGIFEGANITGMVRAVF